jgi:intein/homing endonuclease
LDGKTKSIEDIQAGDAVVSYDVNTDSNYLAEVTKLITNENSIDMARVEFDNGVMIKMTDYHPLYTKEGWSSISDKNYRQLKIGDEVKTVDGWSKVTRIILYQNSKFMTTYTLAIRDYGEDPDNDDNDNFYANGMLAHNVRCT